MYLRINNRGFSLVELMVVIAIIAILAAVAIPMYSNYVTRTEISTDLASIGGLKSGVTEVFMIEKGTENLAATFQTIQLSNNTTIDSSGVITLDIGTTGSNIINIANAKVMLTPSDEASSLTWTCTTTGVDSGYIPKGCTAVA